VFQDTGWFHEVGNTLSLVTDPSLHVCTSLRIQNENVTKFYNKVQLHAFTYCNLFFLIFSKWWPVKEIQSWWFTDTYTLTRPTALLWQKEASDESDISCKRSKCVHWNYCNTISWLRYLSAGWVILLKIQPLEL